MQKVKLWLGAALIALLMMVAAMAGRVWQMTGPETEVNQAVKITPLAAALHPVSAGPQATRQAEAQLYAGFAPKGLPPARLEMVWLELTGQEAGQPGSERVVIRAHSEPPGATALAFSVQQCLNNRQAVSNRLYVEFDTRQTAAPTGTLTFLGRPNVRQPWQVVAEKTDYPGRITGQLAGQSGIQSGSDSGVITVPVTLQPGAVTSLHVYAVSDNDRQQCDPATGAFIGRPVLQVD
jgi:hypothetical protein